MKWAKKRKWFYHCENLFKMTKHDINNIICCIKFEYDFIHQDKWNVNVLMRSTFDMLTEIPSEKKATQHWIKYTCSIKQASVLYTSFHPKNKWLKNKKKENRVFVSRFAIDIARIFNFLFVFVL